MDLFPQGNFKKVSPIRKWSDVRIRERHDSRRWMFLSTIFWSFGNCFISNLVIIFMALSHGMQKGTFFLGLILALPFLAGAMRGFTPFLIQKMHGVKRFCITAYLMEILLLWMMIFWGRPDFLSPFPALMCLTFFWFTANLAEHCATVALFAWSGEIFPEKTRGRVFGNREFYRISGEILSLVICFLAVFWWRNYFPFRACFSEYYLYALLAVIGTLFTLPGTLFLLRVHAPRALSAGNNKSPISFSADKKEGMHEMEISKIEGAHFREMFRQFLLPIQDRRFRPLLYYGAYFAFITQLEQVFQITYPAKIFDEDVKLYGLGLPFLLLLSLRFITRAGQLCLSRTAGKKIDRNGVIPILALSQFLTAFGALCYFFASPRFPFFLFAAPFFYIAYVGLNVGLPQIQIQLSPPKKHATWIAAYGTISGLIAFLGALAGGALAKLLPPMDFTSPISETSTLLQNIYWVQIPFLISFILRALATLFLLKIPKNENL
ncbi:MAG: hypothetical protein Q4C96_05360 [Planctomycetia bacterium]|nr:hypothetical protein [Planctomycetia bacterium]